MSNSVSILLVGVGGYGHVYVDALVETCGDYDFKIVGAVEPFPKPSKSLDYLKERNVPFFADMDEFYKDNSADLCIISSPIHFHKEQVKTALANGSNVLCEKPTAGCVDDVREMIDAKNKAGKFVAIGFQLSFADSILALKKDIIDGVWGKPKLFKSITFFPRPLEYFKARGWAGKKFSPDGKYIMDSIANNAAAHTLHNMFFVLGSEISKAEFPTSCEAELYRANDIETFDAIVARFETECGVPVVYCAAHPIESVINPSFEFEFENGVVKYSMDTDNMVGYFNDGTERVYGKAGDHKSKIYKVLDTLTKNEDKITCTLETTLPHVTAIEMLGKHFDDIKTFSDSETEIIKMKGEKDGLIVKGLEETIRKCFESGKLPKEL